MIIAAASTADITTAKTLNCIDFFFIFIILLPLTPSRTHFSLSSLPLSEPLVYPHSFPNKCNKNPLLCQVFNIVGKPIHPRPYNEKSVLNPSGNSTLLIFVIENP
jgi:hypothetical protein